MERVLLRAKATPRSPHERSPRPIRTPRADTPVIRFTSGERPSLAIRASWRRMSWTRNPSLPMNTGGSGPARADRLTADHRRGNCGEATKQEWTGVAGMR
jgi:hypothetical protein